MMPPAKRKKRMPEHTTLTSNRSLEEQTADEAMAHIACLIPGGFLLTEEWGELKDDFMLDHLRELHKMRDRMLFKEIVVKLSAAELKSFAEMQTF